MERARVTEEWVLRVYSWSTPTISLGRNQRARGLYNLERIRDLELDVVRRPTGGRAILHRREITYSVTAPISDAGELGESYRRINSLLIAALISLGVRATAASPAKRTASPDVTPCFDEPSKGELTVDGRKLAGSAQLRSEGALLQHGSILIEDDQSVLATLGLGRPRTIPVPATLFEALGRIPAVHEVAQAFATAVRDLEDSHVDTLEDGEKLRARVSTLVVRYLDDAWTWRR